MKIVIYLISVLYVILKKSVQNFCFLELFCSLVKNENTKGPGFYTLLVMYRNKLNKIKTTCEYCDLLELEIRDSYKKLYCMAHGNLGAGGPWPPHFFAK